MQIAVINQCVGCRVYLLPCADGTHRSDHRNTRQLSERARAQSGRARRRAQLFIQTRHKFGKCTVYHFIHSLTLGLGLGLACHSRRPHRTKTVFQYLIFESLHPPSARAHTLIKGCEMVLRMFGAPDKVTIDARAFLVVMTNWLSSISRRPICWLRARTEWELRVMRTGSVLL